MVKEKITVPVMSHYQPGKLVWSLPTIMFNAHFCQLRGHCLWAWSVLSTRILFREETAFVAEQKTWAFFWWPNARHHPLPLPHCPVSDNHNARIVSASIVGRQPSKQNSTRGRVEKGLNENCSFGRSAEVCGRWTDWHKRQNNATKKCSTHWKATVRLLGVMLEDDRWREEGEEGTHGNRCDNHIHFEICGNGRISLRQQMICRFLCALVEISVDFCANEIALLKYAKNRK